MSTCKAVWFSATCLVALLLVVIGQALDGLAVVLAGLNSGRALGHRAFAICLRGLCSGFGAVWGGSSVRLSGPARAKYHHRNLRHRSCRNLCMPLSIPRPERAILWLRAIPFPRDPKDEGSCAAAVTLRPASISSRPAGVISAHEEDGSTARLPKL